MIYIYLAQIYLILVLNPLRAKFFTGNINIYSHFVSSILIDMTQVLKILPQVREGPTHTMDILWEKLQWILPLYMKPITFQSKASVVCSVTAAVFIDFCLKKLNVFSQHIGKKTNEYLNSTE